MSAQNSSGIQTLLDAEREAQKIVQKARTFRTQRVKDARSEALKEIEEHKRQKEAEFRAFEERHSGASTQAEQEAAREIEGTLAEIKTLGDQKTGAVVGDLIKAVTEVKPALHRNLAQAA